MEQAHPQRHMTSRWIAAGAAACAVALLTVPWMIRGGKTSPAAAAAAPAAAASKVEHAKLDRMLVTIERLESRYGQEPERSARIAELRSHTHEVVGERRSTFPAIFWRFLSYGHGYP